MRAPITLFLLSLLLVSTLATAQRGGAPSSVQNLQADVHEDGIQLTWDHPYDVDARNSFPNESRPAEFHVYRKEAGGDWSLLATLNARTTEDYFDSAVEPHTTYTYFVSYDDGVESCEPGFCPEQEVTVTSIPFFTSPLALAAAVLGGTAAFALVLRRK